MNVLELDFGSFELLPNIIIGRMNEGIHYNLELNSILKNELLTRNEGNHKLGYISIRENSYSIDPMVHLYNTRFECLCCIAIVESKISGMSSVALESKFFKTGKLKSFVNSEDAIVWANEEILDSSSSLYNDPVTLA